MDLKHPPEFDGFEYAKYKRSLQLWVKATDVAKSKQGILAAMRCTGPAQDLVDTLDIVELEKETGIDYLVNNLSKEFSKNRVDDIFEKYASLFSLQRTGTLQEYSQEFRKRHREFMKLTSEITDPHSKVQIPEYILSMQYILGAKLDTSEQSLIKTVLMTKGSVTDYKLDQVITITRDLLAENYTQKQSSKSATDTSQTMSREAFASHRPYSYKGKNKGKGKHKQYSSKSSDYSRDEYSRPQQSGNYRNQQAYPDFVPMTDYGNRGKYRSNSQYRDEFSRPRSGKSMNRKGRKGKGSGYRTHSKKYVHFIEGDESSNSEAQFASSHVFAAHSSLGNSDLASSAILDTACSKCLCSSDWISKYEDYLQSTDDSRDIQWEFEPDSFGFADDEHMKTDYVAYLPVQIGEYQGTIKTAVLEKTTTPLLMSYSAMKCLGITLDTVNDKLSSTKCNLVDLPLQRTSSGHPIIPLFVKPGDETSSCRRTSTSSSTSSKAGMLSASFSPTPQKKVHGMRSNSAPLDSSLSFSTDPSVYAASRFSGSEADVMKLHVQFGHASSNKLRTMLFKNAKYNPRHVANIEKVLAKCRICKNHQAPPKRPKVGGWQSLRFNELVFMDIFNLKHENKSYLVAHFMDNFSKYTYCEIVPDKTANSMRKAIMSWACLTGNYPDRIYSDNGREYTNRIMYDLCSAYDILFDVTPPHHPWCNGVAETRHGYIKKVFKKVSASFVSDNKPAVEEILKEAVRCVNSCPVTKTGHSPYFLAFLIRPKFLSFNDQPSPSEGMDSDIFTDHIRNQLNLEETVKSTVAELVSRTKINDAIRKRVISHSVPVQQGEVVYHNLNSSGDFRGPFTVIGRRGKVVVIQKGDQIVRVPDYEVITQDEYLMPNEYHFQQQPSNASTEPNQHNGSTTTNEQNPRQPFTSSGFHFAIDTDDENDDRDSISDMEVDSTLQFSPIAMDTQVDVQTPNQFYERQQRFSKTNTPNRIRQAVLRDEFSRPQDYQLAVLPKSDIDMIAERNLKRPEPSSVVLESPEKKKVKKDKPTYLDQTNEAIQEKFMHCPECERELHRSELDVHLELFCPHNKALKVDTTHLEVTKQDLESFKPEFDEAIRAEYESYKQNRVFEEIELDKNSAKHKNIVTSRWVLSWKKTDTGHRKAKARLVLRGFQDSQKDTLVVDSPTVSKQAVKIILQYCANIHQEPHLVDLKTAFLQGDPYKTGDQREVYCYPPPELTKSPSSQDKVTLWLMRKSAYGLCDAPRVWYQKLRKAFVTLGLEPSVYDDCAYVYRRNGATHGLIATHVDDLIFGGTQDFISRILDYLGKNFKIGNHSFGNFVFCGMRVQTHADFSISPDQTDYLKSLKRVSFEDSQSDNTRSLTKKEYSDFRALLGNLHWLSICTRADISFQVNQISMIQGNPTVGDLKALNKVLRDAFSRPQAKLIYPCQDTNKSSLIVMSDAAFGNCPDRVSSQGGHFVFYGEQPNTETDTVMSIIDWCSKKIRRVAKSTFVAEMLAFSKAVDHAIYLKELIFDLTGRKLDIFGYTDSRNFQQLLYNSKCPEDKRSRIDLAYLRESIRSGELKSVEYVETHSNLADILTKRSGPAMTDFRDFMECNLYRFVSRGTDEETLVYMVRDSNDPDSYNQHRSHIGSSAWVYYIK